MRKPNDWDSVQAYGSYKPLEPGGYICRIVKVKETKSRNGRDMLAIFLDIAEGPEADRYAISYKNDTRTTKKWGCMVYQLIEDQEGNTNKGFKTFIDAVEKSNSGFDEVQLWSEAFCAYLKGKLVGGVFGREEYIDNQGKKRFSTKCMQFRDVDTIRKGVEAPEDKLLADPVSQNGWNSDFTPSTDDNDLPF